MSLTLSSLYRLHLFDQMDEENREACDLLQFEMEELDALENIEWDVEPTAEVNRQVSIRGHPLPKECERKNWTRQRRCDVLYERFVSATLRATRYSRQDFSHRREG